MAAIHERMTLVLRIFTGTILWGWLDGTESQKHRGEITGRNISVRSMVNISSAKISRIREIGVPGLSPQTASPETFYGIVRIVVA